MYVLLQCKKQWSDPSPKVSFIPVSEKGKTMKAHQLLLIRNCPMQGFGTGDTVRKQYVKRRGQNKDKGFVLTY